MADSPVIWINGAFGAGKTTIARALASSVPEAIVFDPEDIGMMLQRALPRSLRTTADFQDIPLWRSLTRATIAEIGATYRRPVIVPMTVTDAGYFDEMVGALRRSGVTVHHFTLTAPASTIRGRLLRRLVWPSSTRWALAQLDRCTRALDDPMFGRHINTDGIPVSGIVAEIRREASI